MMNGGSLLVTVLVMAGPLVGCGGSTEGVDEDGSTPTSTPSSEHGATSPASPPASRYVVVQELKDWSSARAHCASLGGHLATIRSAAEQEQLDRLAIGFPLITSYWIGLNDLGREGQWGWESGAPVTYQNWYPGQPDNFLSAEHCAEMHLLNGRTSRWNDIACTAVRHFICEMP